MMDTRRLIKTFVSVGIVGVVFTLLLLASSGAGDDPASYHAYLLASAVVLGASLIAAAIHDRK